MREWIRLFKSYFYKFTAGAFALFIILSILCVLICFLVNWYKPRIDTLYKNNFTVAELNEPNLTEQEKINLDHLIKRNKIIPLSYVYQNTLHYYDALITVLGFLIAFLVALLGLSTILSWFSLKSKIKDDVAKEINSTFYSQFFESWLKEIAERIVTEKFLDWSKNQENNFAILIDRVKEELYQEREKELTRKNDKKGD
jgi:hypothetical protein